MRCIRVGGSARTANLDETAASPIRPCNTPNATSSTMIPCMRARRAHDLTSRGASRRHDAPTTALTNRFSVFLNPELVHAGERIRPFGLECVPAIEVTRETVAIENVPIMLHDRRREFETDECQVILDDERLDVRNREPAFLDMKQQIPALAGAEEIAGLGNAVERRVEQVLPRAADVLRGRAIALRGDEIAGGNDSTACQLAVEAHAHEAARPQQRQQGAPAR